MPSGQNSHVCKHRSGTVFSFNGTLINLEDVSENQIYVLAVFALNLNILMDYFCWPTNDVMAIFIHSSSAFVT